MINCCNETKIRSDLIPFAINLPLLNQALSRTGWTGPEMTADNWKPTLASILSGYDWDKVIADVRPFFEKQTDLDLLTKDNLLGLLRSQT